MNSGTGRFPESVAQAESTFNPSDFGVETWETPEAASLHGQATQPGDTTAAAATPDTIPGFRVQVTTTEDIDYANRLRDSLSNQLDGERVYVVYHPPYYKVRIGDFGERFAAADMLDALRRRGFPDAWIVPDRVLRNPPPEDMETPVPTDSAGGTEPRR